MPLQLRQIDDINDPMVISLSDYKQGRINFENHYFLADCNSDFGGQDVAIPWDTLAAHVDSFIIDNETSDVAVRLVYCYNTVDCAMYLRAQICRMEETEQMANTFLLVDEMSRWYTITEGDMVATQDNSLYDPAYFDNFYYCGDDVCDVNTLQPLNTDVDGELYAKCITFPWTQEILKMYDQNGRPEDASICFGATSYARPVENSTVKYPHGIVMYLLDKRGKPMLNDRNYIVRFENKGCDYGTLCPPVCSVYVLPPISG